MTPDQTFMLIITGISAAAALIAAILQALAAVAAAWISRRRDR